MPVRDMQRYAELVRSGAGEAERIELLKRHREEVRRALASQRECLKLLDAKIDYYAGCLAVVHDDTVLHDTALHDTVPQATAV
jgi:hypothetical protein